MIMHFMFSILLMICRCSYSLVAYVWSIQILYDVVDVD